MICECDAWKEGMRQITGMITLAWTHGIEYTGKQFEFCPWCGKNLKDELKRDDSIEVAAP